MRRIVISSLMVVIPILSMDARGQETATHKMAQDLLDKGSALFDTRDAAAMAATYNVDGEVVVYMKDGSTGEFKTDSRRGRSAVEEGYKEVFKDRSPGAKSKNTVEAAHLVGDDILLIHGKFKVDVSESLEVPFLQTRARKDGKWQVLSMQIFVVNE